MSLSRLSTSVGIALSGAFTGFGLAIIGYDAAVKPTGVMLDKIFWIASAVPAICIAITIVIILFYKLSWFEGIKTGEKGSGGGMFFPHLAP